ncbi:MAG TPA: hypothetical protein VFJ58_23355 [Armatimonadota bacterium]|nr:hypothetical protein [Armatimonadota bacterium]
MAAGVSADLIFIAICAWLFGCFALRKIVPLRVAMIVALIKTAIPFVYFGWFRDLGWTILDDMTYRADGAELLSLHYNPITALTPRGIATLTTMSDGHHILYAWWNLTAEYLFGPHYYAPVFFNVCLTYVACYYLYKTALLAGFSVGYCRGLMVFALLQWDVLTWSSLLNVKDPAVMTLTSITLYVILRLARRIEFRLVLGLLVLVFVFFWIRFYIPLGLMAATGVWTFLYRKGWGKFAVLSCAAAASVALAMKIGFGNLSLLLSLLHPEEIVPGTVRLMLTPQPWSLESASTFLFASSTLHWLLFPATLFGGYVLWRQSTDARLLLIYALITAVLYGMVDALSGPRQRAQIDFILAWMQFQCAWSILTAIRRRRRPTAMNAVIEESAALPHIS